MTPVRPDYLEAFIDMIKKEKSSIQQQEIIDNLYDQAFNMFRSRVALREADIEMRDGTIKRLQEEVEMWRKAALDK